MTCLLSALRLFAISTLLYALSCHAQRGEPSGSVFGDIAVPSSGLGSSTSLTDVFTRGANQGTIRRTGVQSSPRGSTNFPSAFLPNQSPPTAFDIVSGLRDDISVGRRPPGAPSTRKPKRTNTTSSTPDLITELPGLISLPNVSLPNSPPPNVSQSISPEVATALSPFTVPPVILLLPSTDTFTAVTSPSDPPTPVVLDTDASVDPADLEEGDLDGDVDPAVRGVDTNIPEEERQETILRNNVFDGDVGGAAALIVANDIVTGGFGLRVNDLEDRPSKTTNRNTDPDVIAFKALSTAVVYSVIPEKAAEVVALSFFPKCECTPFQSEEYAAIIGNFTEAFTDESFLRAAIVANVTTISDKRRHLLQTQKAPTSSFICSGCWPRKTCKIFSWCS